MKAKTGANAARNKVKRREAHENWTAGPENVSSVKFAPKSKLKVVAKVAKEQGINADAMRERTLSALRLRQSHHLPVVPCLPLVP